MSSSKEKEACYKKGTGPTNAHLVVLHVLLQIVVAHRVQVVGQDPTTFLSCWYCERPNTCEDVRNDIFRLEEGYQARMLGM